MRLLCIQFDDTVDPTLIPKGTTGITVGDGTNTVVEGKVVAWTDAINPEVVEHTHPASTAIGPPAVIEPPPE